MNNMNKKKQQAGNAHRRESRKTKPSDAKTRELVFKHIVGCSEFTNGVRPSDIEAVKKHNPVLNGNVDRAVRVLIKKKKLVRTDAGLMPAER